MIFQHDNEQSVWIIFVYFLGKWAALRFSRTMLHEYTKVSAGKFRGLNWKAVLNL